MYMHMLSHDKFQSLLVKLMHTVIIHQHSDLHTDDSIHEKDLPISNALKAETTPGKVIDLKFSENVPGLF